MFDSYLYNIYYTVILYMFGIFVKGISVVSIFCDFKFLNFILVNVFI